MNHLFTVLDFMVSVGRFIILLGVLIFVHEIGHFFAAKLCNVYVVRLSLGVGKRLFGFKRGETDYCISVIPFGGYVKMVGQEDLPRTHEEAEQAEPDLPDVPPERRFNNQSTWNKLAISFAGPLMNLLFAIPVLWVVFMVGIRVPVFTQHTRIGGVNEGSPAERAGIKPGHRVLSIDGASVGRWEELQLKIWTNENRPLDFELEDLSGETTHVTVTPARLGDSTRATIGIEPLVAEAVSRVVPGMPAERSGLKPGDIILAYDDERPDNESMSKLIETVNQSAGRPLMLTILRDGRVMSVTVVPEKVNVIEGVVFENNMVAYVDDKQSGSVASSLRPGDVITAVDGEPLRDGDSEDLLAARIYDYKGDEVRLAIERPLGFLRKPQEMNVSVSLRQKGMIGVLFSPVVMRKFGPGRAFVKSFGAFGYSFSLTMKTIYYLVSGKVSTKEMAGPIGIAFLTEESLKLGVGYYLNLVAFITINLAIINLLPIPALDGGLIFIAIFESVRRKPLDEKYYILLYKVGLAFILFIVLLATYNDILRAINFFFGGGFIE